MTAGDRSSCVEHDASSRQLPMEKLEVVMSLKMEVAELRTTLDDSRHLTRQYREQTTSLQSKLAAATEERDNLSEKLSKYKAKMLQMKTVIETLRRGRTEMRVQLEAAQSEAIECRNRSRQLLQSNENLMCERDSLSGIVISEDERRASAARRVRRISLLSQVSLGSISLPFIQAETSPHDSNSTIDSNVLADVAKVFAGTDVQVPIANSTSDIPKELSRRPSRRSSWRHPSLIDSLEEETARPNAAPFNAVGTSRRRSLMQRRSSEMSLGLDSVAEDDDLADEMSRIGVRDGEFSAPLPMAAIGGRTICSISKLGDQAPNPLTHKLDQSVDGQNSITLNDIILPRAEDDPLQESDGTNKDVTDFLPNADHQFSNAEFYCSEELGVQVATVPSSVAQNHDIFDQEPTRQDQDLQNELPPSSKASEPAEDSTITSSEPIKRVSSGVLERVIGGLFQERIETHDQLLAMKNKEGKNFHPNSTTCTPLSTRIPRRNSLNSKMA